MSNTIHLEPGTPSALVQEIGEALTDAINLLAHLSNLVKPVQAEPAVSARRAINGTAKAVAPVATVPTRRGIAPAPVALTPTPIESTRQRRRTGIVDHIEAALFSEEGISPAALSKLAGYSIGPAVLDRFMISRDWDNWWEDGEGDNKRYFADPKKVAPAPAPAARRR